MKIPVSESVLQALLIALNFIFALLSISLIALGCVYNDDLALMQVYVSKVDFLKVPNLLIILGVISFISAISGCYLSRHFTRRYFIVYVIFMILLLANELTIACLAFANVDFNKVAGTRAQMSRLLNTTRNAEMRNNFYILEEHLRCCGVEGVDDYASDVMILHNDTLCWRIFQRISRMPVAGCAQIVADNLVRISLEIGVYMMTYSVFQIIHICCAIFTLQRG